ncbi:hypothetical protein L2E82_32171 [Cichorium intybus]|uniref:Uncharacterized protein n=1 Tax=Cichorium intybus TaxID=13427 RepID=A0ACB9BHA1_CICIN|nr:hypothetical protein L2E82_32171 [Cichorium intybus]
MTTPTRMTLQIDPFHNCEGCIRKLKRALSELRGVLVVAIDPNKGEVTIITGHSLEVIKKALKRKFPKKYIFQLQEESHEELHEELLEAGQQDPSYALSNPHNLITDQNVISLETPQHAFDLGIMARSLEIACDIEGLHNVEFVQTNIVRFNFTDCGNQPSSSTFSSTRSQPSAYIEQSISHSKIIRIQELDD